MSMNKTELCAAPLSTMGTPAHLSGWGQNSLQLGFFLTARLSLHGANESGGIGRGWLFYGGAPRNKIGRRPHTRTRWASCEQENNRRTLGGGACAVGLDPIKNLFRPNKLQALQALKSPQYCISETPQKPVPRRGLVRTRPWHVDAHIVHEPLRKPMRDNQAQVKKYRSRGCPGCRGRPDRPA